MIVSCLGTANFFITLPIFAVVASLGVSFVVRPNWPARRFNQRPLPVWASRLFGVGIVLMAVTMSVLAIHEARTDPDCYMGTPSAAQQQAPSRR